MSTSVRNAILGIATVLFLSILLGFFGLSGWGVSMACTGIGVLLYSLLESKSRNRQISPADAQLRASTLSSQPPPGAALLYIYRSNPYIKEGFMGRNLGVDILLDGTAITQLVNPRFTALPIPAGPHTLRAGSGGQHTDTPFTANPGDTIIFALSLPKGATGGIFTLTRETDTAAVLQKLANIPLIAPDTSVFSAPNPPSPSLQ